MTRDQLKIRTQQAIDAIRVFKDKDYGWSEMEKMLYEILIELDDSDWQTGTPTENGLYVVVIKVTDTLYYHRLSNWYKGVGFVVEREGSKVHAWQKIEPYKEESNETDITD